MDAHRLMTPTHLDSKIMKLRQVFQLAALFGGMMLSSCGKDPKAIQAAALEAFKGEMKSIDSFMKESEAAMKENPMSAMGKIKEVLAKLDAVKTDLLPADLKEPFEKLKGATKKITEAMSDLPFPADKASDPAAMQAWAQEQAAKDPGFLAGFQAKMGAFQTKMQSISAEGDAAKDALQAAFDKYGIDVKLDGNKKDAAPAAPQQ